MAKKNTKKATVAEAPPVSPSQVEQAQSAVLDMNAAAAVQEIVKAEDQRILTEMTQSLGPQVHQDPEKFGTPPWTEQAIVGEELPPSQSVIFNSSAFYVDSVTSHELTLRPVDSTVPNHYVKFGWGLFDKDLVAGDIVQLGSFIHRSKKFTAKIEYSI
jgi:hypothetical protein